MRKQQKDKPTKMTVPNKDAVGVFLRTPIPKKAADPNSFYSKEKERKLKKLRELLAKKEEGGGGLAPLDGTGCAAALREIFHSPNLLFPHPTPLF